VRRTIRGQVVLVTGAARGIGAATARRLAARGAQLSLVGREPEALAALARELGAPHAWFEADVTDQPALDRAVAGTIATFGRIDCVLANAGVASTGTVAVTPVEALARTIEVNLIGVVRTVSATLPHVVAARGYYLLVSSAAALAALPGIAAYAASKAGVEQFGNALRLELLGHGVRVGTAHPSWIATDMVGDPQRDLPSFTETLRRLPRPFGRVTSLDACADAFADAVARRPRKLFVPRSLGPIAAIRQLFMSPLSDLVLGLQARHLVPQMEREVVALGRAFGAHSVETAPAEVHTLPR
jgi:NAD(P)-dependent dehydrogenase (short-subunit alcohol dehydrogenase family)